ncbi:MAG: Inosose dehydratase [candidate division WS2 bacterium]|nr:Inosose dehydratase [Candidatus Psychracetigena formicireducens]
MYVAIRDFTVMWLGYKDLFKGLKDLGVNSFELYVSKDLKQTCYQDMDYTTDLSFDLSSEDKRTKVIEELKAQHLNICAILVENDFGKEDLEPEIKWGIDACRVASELGVKAVRINSVMQPQPEISIKEYTERTIESIKKILNSTKGLNVCLAMENHGVIGNKREFIHDVLDGVQSEHLGLTLDTGNFYWSGYPLDEVYKIIQEFTPYVKHVHLKNLTFPLSERNTKREPGLYWPDSAATIYEGDVDHQHIVNILKSSGYNGDLTIEDESLSKLPDDERIKIIKKDIDFVRPLL